MASVGPAGMVTSSTTVSNVVAEKAMIIECRYLYVDTAYIYSP